MGLGINIQAIIHVHMHQQSFAYKLLARNQSSNDVLVAHSSSNTKPKGLCALKYRAQQDIWAIYRPTTWPKARPKEERSSIQSSKSDLQGIFQNQLGAIKPRAKLEELPKRSSIAYLVRPSADPKASSMPPNYLVRALRARSKLFSRPKGLENGLGDKGRRPLSPMQWHY